MTNASDATFEKISALIKPFDTKGITVERGTKFSADLEFDSLTVMDLLAEIEDEFDIMVPLNVLPDLETVGQVADEVEKILKAQ